MTSRDRAGRPVPEHGTATSQVAPGVIDTLGLGYAALVTRPVVMTPLLLLEVALVFAPRVNPLRLAVALDNAVADRGTGWGPVRNIADWLAGSNLVELTSLQLPGIRTPVVATSLTREQSAELPWSVSFSSLPVVALATLLPLLVLIGLVLAVVFRLLLAAGGLGVGSVRDAVNPRLIGLLVAQLIGWLAALAGVLTLVAMPVLIVWGVGLAFGFGGSQLLWLLLLLPVLWGIVHFYFSIHALFVDRNGPFAALRSSYRVVRAYFWQSTQFIATTLLIMTGLTFALRQLASSVGGVFVAVVINTFVAAGIIIAAMIFYRDRARLLGLPGYASGK